MRDVLVDCMPDGFDVDKCIDKKVKNLVDDMYFNVWQCKCTLMDTRGVNLEGRLKSEYDMSFKDLKRTGKGLRDAHNRRVKEARDLARLEGDQVGPDFYNDSDSDVHDGDDLDGVGADAGDNEANVVSGVGNEEIDWGPNMVTNEDLLMYEEWVAGRL